MVKDIQAFPRAGFSGDGGYGRPELGMTLRDYFAAKAMNAFISKAPAGTAFGTNHAETNESFAIASYVMADAMMKVRGVPTK